MAHFTILEAPDGDIDRTILIKDGFSVAALLFTVLWTLWHRMWVVSAVLFSIFVGIEIGVELTGMSSFIGTVLEIAVGLIFGFEARSLWSQALQRSGFRLAGLVEATSMEAAELKYYIARKQPVLAPSTRKFQMSPQDTLGLFGAH